MKKRWLVLAAVVGAVLGIVVAGHWPQERFIARLDDDSPAVRAAAIRALPLHGNEGRIIKMLEDEDADVRLVAAMALANPYLERQDSNGALRAKALVSALKDQSLAVRREAAWSLSWLGSPAWSLLKEALTDPDPHVRAGAALAARFYHYHKDFDHKFGPSADFEFHLERLQHDPDLEGRKNAKPALRDYRP
jgi:hypothetical protein